jgi:hypothetical protein
VVFLILLNICLVQQSALVLHGDLVLSADHISVLRLIPNCCHPLSGVTTAPQPCVMLDPPEVGASVVRPRVVPDSEVKSSVWDSADPAVTTSTSADPDCRLALQLLGVVSEGGEAQPVARMIPDQNC